MANIQKCQARTRIGQMRISGMRGFKKPRTIGEVFELDLDDPIEGPAYRHLLANGAIKPIGGSSKEVSAKEREPVAEPCPAPVICEPECMADPEEIVIDTTEPEEIVIDTTEPVEIESIGPETKLTYIYEFYDSEIEFLTEDQIDTLRRIGVEIVADIPSRTDQDILSIHGIGKGKVRQLRQLYDRYGGDDGAF